ncbi:hypothetical protein NQZ68_023651 [Dissostichus eleginoides]|nr:hypothetical protein NQZ68_023651 [Dissostichus eleginoides]
MDFLKAVLHISVLSLCRSRKVRLDLPPCLSVRTLSDELFPNNTDAAPRTQRHPHSLRNVKTFSPHVRESEEKGRAPRARDGRDPMGARRRGSRLRLRDIRRRALLPRATECTDEMNLKLLPLPAVFHPRTTLLKMSLE